MQDYDPAYDLAKAAGKARTTKPPPTEADLAETLEVQFTTEITELAEELDNNPHKIYEWVKQNITYEPYYGSLKGAQQTLGELSGNNYDQASLLIAMFRVSGVYCRYMSGTMELVNVKPEIKLNDTVILTGPEIPLGSSIELNTTLTSPNLGTDKLTKDITYGIAYAIGVPALDYSGDQLTGHLDTVESFEGTLHDSVNAMDDRAGELLHNISISYFRQVHMNSRLLESLMRVHNTKMPSVALFVAHAVYDELFGMPFSPPLMEGLSIDAIKVAASSVAIDGDMSRRKEFIKQRGLNSSYLEHKILENLLQIESVSAVKALQTAAKEGIPVYTIDSNNADTILPQLTLSEEDITDIRNAVNAQKEVTVSRDNVTLNDWTGVGYIVRDPETGAGAYMISHSLGSVGSTTAPVSNPEFAGRSKVAHFILGQMLPGDSYYIVFIDIKNYTEYIYTLPIWSDMGYVPNSVVEITDKRLLLLFANSFDTWIFYYIGHGQVVRYSQQLEFLAITYGQS